MLKFVLLVGTIFFAAEVTNPHQVDRSPARIQALIVELGNDAFVVRERAEAQLLQIGLDAFPELRQAAKGDDVEIAQRSKRILSQFELIYRGKESESVRVMVDQYTQTSNIARKSQIVWFLTDMTEYPNGEGLRTLCRIARFDPEYTLRAEAVKCLIAAPPPTVSKRNEWFQTLRSVFDDRDDDELLRLVRDYAGLSVELTALREEAEKKADTLEMETGTPVDYPVPFTASPELRNRVMAFTDHLAAFQSKPENSSVQPGNRYDILLFHALAELQDGAGLIAERDRTLEAALAVRTQKMHSDNPFLLIDPLEATSFWDHLYVAARLMDGRWRFHWAERHLLLVIAEGSPVTKVRSYGLLWSIKRMCEQYQEAADYHRNCIELLESPDFQAEQDDIELKLDISFDDKLRECRANLDFCQAKLEAEAGNWQKAKTAIDHAFQNNPTMDSDMVILRYEISRHLDNLDENYRRETKNMIDGVLNDMENKFHRRDTDMSVPLMCNNSAWLLANTDGDFPIALTLIRIAVKAEPESPMYLDTMAHVYALGREYKKAVEIQKEAVRLAPEATALQLPLKRFRELAKD